MWFKEKKRKVKRTLLFWQETYFFKLLAITVVSYFTVFSNMKNIYTEIAKERILNRDDQSYDDIPGLIFFSYFDFNIVYPQFSQKVS